jgi:hypothetical protein
MRKSALAAVAGVLLGGSLAQADLTVDPGNWSFTPNSGTHRISIGISGSGEVMGAVVVLEIAGAGTLPKLTGGEIVTGTIFASNFTSPNYDFNDVQCAYLDVSTSAGTVPVNGLTPVAFIDVDTTGASLGSYTLALTNTRFGDSDVQTNPPVVVTYLGGTLALVPEPMFIGTLASGSLMLLMRKRQN